jgi:tRNA (guanine9-N1)-methyltransferase
MSLPQGGGEEEEEEEDEEFDRHLVLTSDNKGSETTALISKTPTAPAGRIIIDLAFEGLMSAKELNSLAGQVCRCYAINRRSTAPISLIVTGCAGNARFIAEMKRSFPDFRRWQVQFVEEDLEQYLSSLSATDGVISQLYLSADAEESMLSVSTEESATYIIGGLVDRNRHKNVAKRRAAQLNISTIKLPLCEHVQLIGSQVLTIVHVYEILCKQRETSSWAEAVRSAIPDRKRLTS